MDARPVPIYTEDNNFQHLIVLRDNRQKRGQYGEFFVEGVRSVNQALRNGWQVTAIVYPKGQVLSEWAKGVIDGSKTGTRFELTPALMQKLSGKQDTSELVITVKIPPDDLARIKLGRNPLLLVLDRPSSMGNLGTIIRSADALGCQGIVMTGHAVDLYDPETVRASMGSLFKLPVVRVASHADLLGWFDKLKATFSGLKVLGATERAQTDICDCDVTGPLVLLVGNETDGLNWNFRQWCNELVRIPMRKETAATSLNVACAASIFLYEIGRQRSHPVHS